METKETKKKVGRGYTEEEFKKLPKEKQQKIIEARNKRINRLNSLANQSLGNIEEGNPTDREFNSKFYRMYIFVRKGLVILRAKKVTGQLTGEELYNQTIAMFEKAKEI